MKLITKKIKKRFAELGRQDIKNPIVVAKFFCPSGSATWYATSFNESDNICFGYVTGLQFDEWGYFSLAELESLKCPFGLAVERDFHFEECKFSTLKENGLI